MKFYTKLCILMKDFMEELQSTKTYQKCALPDVPLKGILNVTFLRLFFIGLIYNNLRATKDWSVEVFMCEIAFVN